MSGDMRGANACHVPCDPLALHIALPNRVLAGGVCYSYLPRFALRAGCASILLCALKRSATRALIPRLGFALIGGAPFASARRRIFFLFLFSQSVVHHCSFG